jgi:hypothetical protein
MALTSAYVLPTNRIPDLFGKIRDGQAPERFTHQLLKDWGFGSTNDRAFIPLLKALGYLTADGKPTPRYHEYRDHSRSKAVMAQALRDAYSDVFLIKEHPVTSDKATVEGKFKSFHNASDNVAGLMTKTFFGLLALADLNAKSGAMTPLKEAIAPGAEADSSRSEDVASKPRRPSLHYNIQVHLPATKDVEVYNAIFKSLRDHLFNE